MRRSIVHTCANGLRVLVWPRRGARVVSTQVWVETGSMLEGVAYAGSGISHLLEHMVFKGTDEYSASELGEAVSALGGLWNAYTSTDRTVYHIEGPAVQTERFLHILAQLTLHPTFPAEEWEREREVIRREMDMYRDDPNDVSYRALIETLFKKHPRRLPVIGEREVFDALTPEDMKRYHAERYVPAHMFVCIVGDVEAESVIAAAEREFGARPAHRPTPLPALPEEPRQWGARVHRCEFSQPTSTLMLAWRIPSANHPDMAALSLLSCILGDGRAAWLYKTFHDERALVHDVSTLVIPHTGGEGALVVEADVDRSRRDELCAALLEWLAELPKADFTAAMARAKRQQRVRQIKALSTVQGAADMLGSFWHNFRSTAACDEWRAAIEAVTTQELQNAAARWLRPGRLTEVSVDPTGSNSAAPTDERDERADESHTSFTLPNGLRCVVQVDRRLPMVYATLALGAGCRVEDETNTGACALLAECLPKGTHTRSCEQIAALAEEIGGALHTQAGNNSLLLSLRCLAEETPTMLELLADVALHPSLPQEAVLTAREDLLTDIQEDEEDPVSCAFRRLRKLCFGSVSYGNSPGGELDSVSKLTREELCRLHEQLMCGCNAVLSLAGDLQPAVVETLLRKLFAEMPPGTPPALADTPPQRSADAQLPAPSDKEQVVLAMAMPSLPLAHEDMPLLLLFDEWCQDMSGPIYAEIRERRGLAYHASSSLLMGVDAGCLYFSLETSPELLHEARAALDATLSRLAVEGMSAAALERARATALSARMLAAQSIGKRCAASAINTLLGLGADYEERMTEAMTAVTHEQMQAFIRSRLLAPGGPRTYVTLMPS